MILTKDIALLQRFELEKIIFSEEEIIAFAQTYDPLEFHTSKEVAERSWFKGLIASGPHAFNTFYKLSWVPLFGHSVVCGLELNNWKFLKPVYAGDEILCTVIVLEKTDNAEKRVTAIKWGFELTNNSKEHYQTLDMTVLHKL